MQLPNSTKWSVISLLFITAIPVSILTYANHKAGQAHMVSVAQASERVTPTPTPQNNVEVQANPSLAVTVEVAKPESNEKEEIDAYIRTIFGKDAKVAIAVNRVECNPANKQYPKCVYHTDHEYSVGIFQINLFNKTHAIHANKVPGKTMEEKIESLKDPYINTLVAYKIFQDSGFAPWSGYTSGRYLDHMGE